MLWNRVLVFPRCSLGTMAYRGWPGPRRPSWRSTYSLSVCPASAAPRMIASRSDGCSGSNYRLAARLEEDLDSQHKESDDHTCEHRHREVPSGEAGAMPGEPGP